MRSEQLPARAGAGDTYAAAVSALVAVTTEMARQIAGLEEQVKAGSGRHPGAEIYLSQPGLGVVLGAWVLAEIGDDPGRWADVRARRKLLWHGAGDPSLRHQTGRARPEPTVG